MNKFHPETRVPTQFFEWMGCLVISNQRSHVKFGSIKVEIPGTLNNQFLMDVWFNNNFPCKDFESSN